MTKNIIYTIIANVEKDENTWRYKEWSSHDNFINICIPTIKSYAKKYNCDFKIFNHKHMKNIYPSPHFINYSIFEDFEKSNYDKMMYIDSDIIINKHSPNIFEKLNKEGIYMRESHDFLKMNEWFKESYNEKFDIFFKKYWNSGVILSDKKTIANFNKHVNDKQKLDNKAFIKGPWGGEMASINYFLCKSNIVPNILNPIWNFTRDWKLKLAKVSSLDKIYFIHYAGKNKYKRIKDDIDKKLLNI